MVAIDWSAVAREHYAAACRVIKRLMPACLQGSYDPEDFVSDAMLELLNNPARFAGKGSSLLTLVAKRRMIDAARSPRSRLIPLEVDLIDRQPPVSLEVEAAELRESILCRAGNSGNREVVDLRCQGHTLPEIAKMTGVNLRTLQRYFKEFIEANGPEGAGDQSGDEIPCNGHLEAPRGSNVVNLGA